MYKILFAQDSRRLTMNAIGFGCYLAKLSHSRLTAVFLEDETLEEPFQDRIRIFSEACRNRGVVSRVHQDRGISRGEILDESRFADLIIVDAETWFEDRPVAPVSTFVNHLLAGVECPVVISPTSFDRIEEVVFAYNATASSVKAIKQFTYLFPGFGDKKVIVVHVREGDETAIEESFKMKEWLAEYYREVEFHLLRGNPMDQLFGYLLQRKHAFVVMGAYGRGILSRSFRPSHARLIIRSLNLPVFIAHR